MNRIISAVIATTLLAGGGIMAAASPASADTRPCMSRTEFRAIKNGMTLTRVAGIVGSKGKVSVTSGSGPYSMTIRSYTACGSFPGSANVTYMGGRITAKVFFG